MTNTASGLFSDGLEQRSTRTTNIESIVDRYICPFQHASSAAILIRLLQLNLSTLVHLFNSSARCSRTGPEELSHDTLRDLFAYPSQLRLCFPFDRSQSSFPTSLSLLDPRTSRCSKRFHLDKSMSLGRRVWLYSERFAMSTDAC